MLYKTVRKLSDFGDKIEIKGFPRYTAVVRIWSYNVCIKDKVNLEENLFDSWF